MKIDDLGVVEGPVLLFGGPYSNLQATQAVLQVPSAHAICTGDMVAYCGDPVATVARLRDAGVVVVAGNCEKQLAAGEMDCGCGFEAGSTCDRLSAAWFAHANAAVDRPTRDWMGRCPDMVVFRHHERRVAVIHGGVRDVSRFIWSTSPEADFAEEITHIQSVAGPVNTVVAGHSGIGFIRRVGGVDWINAGVIGMPPNDGSAETEYLVMDQEQVRFHCLTYDVQGARDAMVAAGLVQGYHDALVSGYWPSEDVLPPDLRVSDSG